MNVIMPLIYASIALITFLLSVQVCYELPNGYQILECLKIVSGAYSTRTPVE